MLSTKYAKAAMSRVDTKNGGLRRHLFRFVLFCVFRLNHGRLINWPFKTALDVEAPSLQAKK